MNSKTKAIDRAKYLLESLDRVRNILIEQTKEHAETCILTGEATPMCLAHFSNLDRICNEVIKSIELIEEYKDV